MLLEPKNYSEILLRTQHSNHQTWTFSLFGPISAEVQHGFSVWEEPFIEDLNFIQNILLIWYKLTICFL